MEKDWAHLQVSSLTALQPLNWTKALKSAK